MTLLLWREGENVLLSGELVEKIETFVAETRTGENESYKGLWKFWVVRMGGIQLAESKEKLLAMSLALIPEDDKLENLRSYTLAGGTRSPAEFVVDPSGKIDLYISHCRFHKLK
jgi:hypothetical protein